MALSYSHIKEARAIITQERVTKAMGISSSYYDALTRAQPLTTNATEATTELPCKEVPIFISAPGVAPSEETLGTILSISNLFLKSHTADEWLTGFLSLGCLFLPELYTKAELPLNDIGIKVAPRAVASKSDMSYHVTFMDSNLEQRIFEIFCDEHAATDNPDRFTCSTNNNDVQHILPVKIAGNLVPVYVGIHLCLMAKSLTQDSHSSWLSKRLETFYGAGHISKPNQLFQRDHFPSLIICESIHRQFADTTFREFVYTQILGKTKLRNSWGYMCRAILILNRGAELTHIHLIIKFICEYRPAVLTHPKVSKEVTAFIEALEAVESVDATQRPFIKLIKPAHETDYLNRTRFTILTQIARKIGLELEPTLGNYLGGTVSAKGEVIVDEIINYATRVEEGVVAGEPRAQQILENGQARSQLVTALGNALNVGAADADMPVPSH